jgi:hypothetical protein
MKKARFAALFWARTVPLHTGRSAMVSRRFFSLILICLCLSTGAVGAERGTSPHHRATVPSNAASSRAFNTLITFSEFPVGTHIKKQYANMGIIFGGDDPFITTDSSNPSAPVLSGTPQYFGAIEGKFVRTDNGRKTALAAFNMDAGYFDSVGSVLVTLYDKAGNVILTRKNTELGIQTFKFRNLPTRVHRFRIDVRGSEANGFAIDNIAFKRRP